MSLAYFLYGARDTTNRGLFKAACHSAANFGSWEMNSESKYCLNLGHHDLNNVLGDFKSSFWLARFKVKFGMFVGFSVVADMKELRSDGK